MSHCIQAVLLLKGAQMSTVQNAFLNRDLDIHATQTTQIRSSYITQDVTFKQKSNKVWHDGKIIHYMLFVCLYLSSGASCTWPPLADI